MIKPAVTFESHIWQKGRDKEQISAAASSQRLQAGLRESNRIATTEVNRNLLLPNAIPNEKANLQQKQRHNTKGAFHLQPNTLHPSLRPRPVHVNQRDTWPTDSVTSTSFSDVVGDVWVTSDSDTEPNPYRKPQRRNSTPLKSRLLSQPQQKQEQTSRSMPRNTARHLANAVTTADNIYGPPRPVIFPTPLHADESTDEAMSATADTRLSPDETFSPASEDVRELFPRSSSLSPRKKAKQRQRNRPVHRGSGVYRSREGAPAFDEKLTNTDMARRSSKSPWTRAKAERLGSLGQETQALQLARPETREAFVQCTNCSDSGERLRNLEAEVAQLRDDVLALNTAIHRSGLPFLACLR